MRMTSGSRVGRAVLWAGLCCVALAGCAVTRPEAPVRDVRAVFLEKAGMEKIQLAGTQAAFADKLAGVGFNAVIVDSNWLDPALVSAVHTRGLKLLGCVSVYRDGYGQDLARTDDGAVPVDQWGRRMGERNGCQPLCPTDAEVVARRLRTVEALCRDHPIDGLVLDFMHFPGCWTAGAAFGPAGSPLHTMGGPVIPEGCFNDSCLGKFQADTGIALPWHYTAAEKTALLRGKYRDEWTAWKIKVIADFVGQARKVLRRHRPLAPLGVVTAPCSHVYDNLLQPARRVLGQDYKALEPHCDFFSPKLSGAGARQTIASVARQTARPLVPVLQGPAPAIGSGLREMKALKTAGVAVCRWEDLSEPDLKVVKQHFLPARP